MRFLVDAQLPRRLSHALVSLGHDSLHTLDLPGGNRTTDTEIAERSVAEQRVVVTKDADFVDDLLIRGVPYKLLLISTGNIRNSALEELLLTNIQAIVAYFSGHTFVEIDTAALRIHF